MSLSLMRDYGDRLLSDDDIRFGKFLAQASVPPEEREALSHVREVFAFEEREKWKLVVADLREELEANRSLSNGVSPDPVYVDSNTLNATEQSVKRESMSSRGSLKDRGHRHNNVGLSTRRADFAADLKEDDFLNVVMGEELELMMARRAEEIEREGECGEW